MNPHFIAWRRSAAPVLIALALVACAPAAGGSSSPSGSASPSVAPPIESASETPTTAPSSEPTDDLGAFTCELPISGDGTVARAQITDVRVGSHAGYDR
ncbi:MAG TPA: hypothetical protein VF114_10190, partial [Candidatus Limnocylindria bacterium]